MSNLFLVGIYLLIIGNVCVAGAVVVFLTLFLKRQKQGFQYLTAQLIQLDKTLKIKKSESKTTQLTIPASEPIAKYESVSLPDDVKIDFVED